MNGMMEKVFWILLGYISHSTYYCIRPVEVVDNMESTALLKISGSVPALYPQTGRRESKFDWSLAYFWLVLGTAQGQLRLAPTESNKSRLFQSSPT